MQRFTRLYLTLDETSDQAEKIEVLARYFGEAAPGDALTGPLRTQVREVPAERM